MSTPISFRWLGVAGLELKVSDHILVIDPYFTRFPLRRALFGRVQPSKELIAEKIQRCNFVLITHAHFDHAMDVPDVVRNTGAVAFGSPNTCRLLAACGVPDEKIQRVKAGDKLTLASFNVEVLRAEHVKIPGFTAGRLPPTLKPPLRARDYRMDEDFAFMVTVGGHRLLTDPGERPEAGVPADVLFVFPDREEKYYKSLLPRVQPKIIIPNHWDDFFRPLTKPLRPHIKRPRFALPPVQRVNLTGFTRMVQHIAPGTQVLTPDIFQICDLTEYVRHSTNKV